MVFINPATDILAISLAVSVLSQAIRRKFSPPARLKAQQAKIKESQQKVSELAKKNDPASQKKKEEAEQEMLSLTSEMMGMSTKTMGISMIVLLPAFWFMQATYKGATIPLPVQLPWLGENWSMVLLQNTNWLGWYVLTGLVFSLLLNA
ncbi:MAG: DUF106 domain-containing protein, partial [Candidatus Diapherotrites archaeon]|nr:DUF106 domain-containing protein [Candidatus Diapherotrites archaeon]